MIKRNILTFFALLSIMFVFAGCGSSGHNEVGVSTASMAEIRLSLSSADGKAVLDPEVSLYTADAALNVGLNKLSASPYTTRASRLFRNLDGVYGSSGKDSDGNIIFNVPTGEYTVVAEKGDAKAVVTALRASGSFSRFSVTLKPTATISGRVMYQSVPRAAAMVFLEKTSFVAFTKSDGTFELTGVPTDFNYKLSAVATLGSEKLTATPQTLSLSSSELTLKANDLVLSKSSVSTVKKYIKGQFAGGIANKIVIAVLDGLCTMAVSGADGKFSVPVEAKGDYKVTTIDPCQPELQSICYGF